MSYQRSILLFALCCSLALHVAGLGIYVEYARTHPGRRFQLEYSRLAPRPTTAPTTQELLVYPDFGSDNGTGIGTNSSPGDVPLQAREADTDQALLSRDPVGMSRTGGAPSQRSGPQGDGAGGVPAVALTTPPDPQPPRPERLDQPPQPPVAPRPAPEVASGLPLPQANVSPIVSEVKPEVLSAPTPPVQIAAAPAPPVVPIAPPQPSTGDGRTPGTPQSQGVPLPQSESDSDPFSRISANLKFRDGRLVERWGRLVKTTRPQVNISGQLDVLSLNNPVVVLEVHIAPSGKVTDVKVAHSSGSNQIDQPTRQAVYDWWFEPAKNNRGKPVADVIYFTVEFI